MFASLVCNFLSLIFIGSIFQEAIILGHPYPYSGRTLLQKLLSGDELLSSMTSKKEWKERSDAMHTKVVFPVPEDVVLNRSYQPDLGFLTDLAFLLLPKSLPLPASGMLRLSRDLFESEQCVQFVSCEMTKVAQRHGNYLNWMNNLLQDFPFQGDVADRLREGSIQLVKNLKKREQQDKDKMDLELDVSVGSGNVEKDDNDRNLCSFSCSPIGSLTRGLKILSLLHDLVRTVKY